MVIIRGEKYDYISITKRLKRDRKLGDVGYVVRASRLMQFKGAYLKLPRELCPSLGVRNSQRHGVRVDVGVGVWVCAPPPYLAPSTNLSSSACYANLPAPTNVTYPVLLQLVIPAKWQ